MNKLMSLSEKTLRRLAIGSVVVTICVGIFGFNYIENNSTTTVKRVDKSVEVRRGGEHTTFEYLYGEE